jgi:hypothetical protein
MEIPVRISHVNHSGLKDFFWRLWNRAQQSIVVKVKNSSIESRRMKRLMVA